MAKILTEDRLSRPGGAPLKVAMLVAALGVLGMLIVDHGPWNKPKVQQAQGTAGLYGELQLDRRSCPCSRRQGHADRAEAAGGA